MIRTHRGVTIALAAAAVLLTGCTGDDGARAEQTPTPDSVSTAGTGSDYRFRIPASVRKAFFGGATPTEYRHLEPRLSRDDAGRVSILQRRLPGCDTKPWIKLGVDQRVRDFTFSIRDSAAGFVVARQLTVYDDAATAKQFVPQMNNRVTGCYRYADRDVHASLGSMFSPDRFFGITVNHDGTVFSEGSNTTLGRSARWVEVITRENNAVVLTRVTDPAFEGNPGVIERKDQQPAFVAEVRRQGTISARTLSPFR